MLELITMTGAAVASAASLVELAKNIQNADLQSQVAELKVQLAIIQNGTASLIRENGKLKEELEHLKDDKASPLIFNSTDGLYYDSETEVPYCPNCYEGKKERRHLKITSKRCPNCHEAFIENGVGVAVVYPPNRRPLPKII